MFFFRDAQTKVGGSQLITTSISRPEVRPLDPYSFSLDVTSSGGTPELARLRLAALWCWRLGRLTRKNLDLLKKLDNNGMRFDGPVLDCDVCAVGKNQQLADPKSANHKAKHLFQLTFADLIWNP